MQIVGEVVAAMRHSRGSGAFVAVLAALTWSVGFAIWAFTGTAGTACTATATGETCSSTPLLDGLGLEVLAVLAPAVVCLAVWVLLRRYCTRGQRLARVAALVIVMLFAAFCVLATLSVGPFLAAIVLLLGLAVAATEPPPAALTPAPLR